MKKTLVALSILVILGGFIFFVGWIQLSVPAGKYGVLISKTGGINSTPVEPGRFRWQWERLIPTNSELVLFDLAPRTKTVSASGVLPSGDLYGDMLEGKPDFSWNFEMTITGRLRSGKLPYLVGTLNIRDQAGLDAWVDSRLSAMSREAGQSLVAGLLGDSTAYSNWQNDPVLLDSAVKAALARAGTGEIEIVETGITRSRLPDFALYATATRTYKTYQEERNQLLDRLAKSEAGSSVTEYLQIERFARLGEVLTRYPILIDYLAVSRDDAAEAFKAIRSLR